MLPSSVCCLASSATASPTLERTELSASLARHCSSFPRIASRSGAWRVRKRSTVCPEAFLRGLEDWRLKITAAKVRVCKLVSTHTGAASPFHDMTYRRLLGQLDLLGQAHQQDLWSLGNPLVVELLLGGCARDIVGRLEALQQVRKGGVYFGREDRHGVWWSWVSWAAARGGNKDWRRRPVQCSAAGAEGKARDSGRWGIALRQRLPSKCRRASTMARGVEKSVRGRGAVGKQLQGPGGDYSTVRLLWKFKFLGRSRSAAAVPAKTQKCQRQGCVLIAAPLRDSLAGGPRFSAPCPDHPLLLLPWPVILIAGGHYAGLEVRALPNTRRRRRLAAVTGTALASLPTQGRYLVEASSLWTPAGGMSTAWLHTLLKHAHGEHR